MNRTVWMFFTFLALLAYYGEVQTAKALKLERRLVVQTYYTNTLCLSELQRIQNLLEYTGHNRNVPQLDVVLLETNGPEYSGGMGGSP